MSTPLVSCLMPTADRRRFVPQAIRLFLRQDHPERELIILDDGSDAVDDLVPRDDRIHYERLPRRLTTGEKRNLAAERAHGDILLHWDDDDWFSTSRIRLQLEALLASGADVCGVSRMWFFDARKRAAWEYVYPQQAKPWLAGGSLCFHRAFWRGNPFPALRVGEDSRFVWARPDARMHAIADNSFYAALVHDRNTSPRRLHDARYQPRDYSLLAARLGPDLAFYEGAQKTPSTGAAIPVQPPNPDTPTFSICYTSRRAARIGPVVQQWRERASHPESVEFIVAVDSIDTASASAARIIPGIRLLIQDAPPFNCVRGWNCAAAVARGRVLIAASDDIEPPQGWDALLQQFQPGWMDREAVVLTDDGLFKTACHLGIMSRPRHQRLGYLFHPDYESMYCDTDMAEHAAHDGVLLDARRSLRFQHHHVANRQRAADSVDATHAAPERFRRGATLIQARRAAGFPPPAAASSDQGAGAAATLSVSRIAWAAYLQVVRDDFCLFEVMERLCEEGVRNFFVAIPDQHWSGRPTPESDIEGIQAAVDRLGGTAGVNIQMRRFDVGSQRRPGMTRVAVETVIRNAALDWIRASGFRHCLIVDDDELWRRGTLDRLEQAVVRTHPAAAACRMTPVAGVPGWPIENNRDTVTIYLDLDRARFRSCRSPSVQTLGLPFNGVIHFTAVKRTRDELAAKMRDSGHYDDPHYDFEGWIRNTLPNLRPGSRNIHMYRPVQIWPTMRAWSDEEIAEIPPSLYPYLAGMPTPVAAAADRAVAS